MNSTDEVVSSGLQMPELSEELQIKESFFDNNVSIDNWELSNSNQFSSFIKSYGETVGETVVFAGQGVLSALGHFVIIFFFSFYLIS